MFGRGKFGAHFGAEVERNGAMRQRFLAETHWYVEHLRRQQRGALYDWIQVTPANWDHNICTDEGLNLLLDVMFHGTTQIATWYVLIFNTDTTPAAGTTYAVPVFTESSDYDEANRPAYDEAAASGKSMTNAASKATFTINAGTTIYGGALVGGGTDANTKGDVAGGGAMYAAAKFTSSKVCVDDDVLKVTVVLTAADV